MLKSVGLHYSLLSAIDEIQQNRDRDIAWTRRLSEMMWSLYERLSEPPTSVTEEGRKPENLAYKSNDDHNIELDEQSQEELPKWELSYEQNHTEISSTTRKAVHRLAHDTYRVLRFAVSDWNVKTLVILMQKHNNVSQWQSYSFLQGKLRLSKEKPEKDKYDTRDKKQHNLLQYS